MKWKREAPGYYTAPGGWEIIHVEIPDEGNGYGRTDEWRLIQNGEWHDSYETLRDAKGGAA